MAPIHSGVLTYLNEILTETLLRTGVRTLPRNSLMTVDESGEETWLRIYESYPLARNLINRLFKSIYFLKERPSDETVW